VRRRVASGSPIPTLSGSHAIVITNPLANYIVVSLAIIDAGSPADAIEIGAIPQHHLESSFLQRRPDFQFYSVKTLHVPFKAGRRSDANEASLFASVTIPFHLPASLSKNEDEAPPMTKSSSGDSVNCWDEGDHRRSPGWTVSCCFREKDWRKQTWRIAS
jgi:hypothetical protein